MSEIPNGTPESPSEFSADGKKAYFPRSAELPPHSPMFWVAQKDRFLRQLLIRDIESVTNRNLVVYFANRYEQGSDIQAGDIAKLHEIISDFSGEPVDILLETNGGQTDATEALISMVKNIIFDLRVIVANAAKSNGTLLALAAKSIVMGPTSELGPIEPSLSGIPCSILDTPQIAAQNFPLHMTGKFALQQSRNIATQLLSSGMMNGQAEEIVRKTVDALATRDKFPSHGSVVDYREAKQIGLNIEYLSQENETWRRIWLLYCMYDNDARCGNLLKVFENRSRSLAIAASAPTPLPAR